MTEPIEPMVKLDGVERHQFTQHLVDQARSEGGTFQRCNSDPGGTR
jgi:hypothetical protein